jgi:phospholipid transport system substrate-binding protein
MLQNKKTRLTAAPVPVMSLNVKLAFGAVLIAAAGLFSLQTAHAQATSVATEGTAQTGDMAPDTLIRTVSADVLASIKADTSIKQGDLKKITALVDTKVLPHVDFERMTASAVGRYWRQATPTQQTRLQEEFKLLLVRTYSGALSQVGDQTIQLKPLRSAPEDKEVIVRSEVRGKGDPVQLDYRMEKNPNGWKIYDVNVMGVWLVETYRSSFAQEIGTNGIDGLITKLAERNKTAATRS